MSEKKNKETRKILKSYYKHAMNVWLAHKPPRWRFIAYMKWKRLKPAIPRELRGCRGFRGADK